LSPVLFPLLDLDRFLTDADVDGDGEDPSLSRSSVFEEEEPEGPGLDPAPKIFPFPMLPCSWRPDDGGGFLVEWGGGRAGRNQVMMYVIGSIAKARRV
jgi:hypothetical protein